MEYNTYLTNRFAELEINLVRHDTSPTGLPCYIEVCLGRMPPVKTRGTVALDIGNYIYRTTGLPYQMCPEYVGRGKNATLRFYMSWDNVEPVIPNIYKACGFKSKPGKHLPFSFTQLIIQNKARGVVPNAL